MTNVAAKIIEGVKLTPEEFAVAQDRGIYPKELPYNVFEGTHYTGSDVQGYICTRHKNGLSNRPVEVEGIEVTYRCGFGLHLQDLEKKHLSMNNVAMLSHRFGSDVLDLVGIDPKEEDYDG